MHAENGTGNKALVGFPCSFSSLPHAVCQSHRRRERSDLLDNGHAESCRFKSF